MVNVSNDILPDEKLDCVVYGCTSGTIAAGYDSIKKKIEEAKPNAKVTTPSTAAINALKKMSIGKVAIFTPYSKNLNDKVVDYFKNENFTVTTNSYFDISVDWFIEISNIVKSVKKNRSHLNLIIGLIWTNLLSSHQRT